jgi:hypothetical protein
VVVVPGNERCDCCRDVQDRVLVWLTGETAG